MWHFCQGSYINGNKIAMQSMHKSQGLVKGAKLCLNPFLAGWRSLSKSKIKVRISETKFLSFYKTLPKLNIYYMDILWIFVPFLKKPPNFEETCNLDKRCNEDCDVCCEMPYHIDTGKKQLASNIKKYFFDKLFFSSIAL